MAELARDPRAVALVDAFQSRSWLDGRLRPVYCVIEELATEGDLQRVNDLLREIRRQLRPLAKQAEAAARHDALQGELDELQRYIAGQELVGLQLRLESVGAKRADALRRSDEGARHGVIQAGELAEVHGPR